MARILVVEDEEKLRDIIILFLQNEGFEADGAESGEKALELFASVRYDLVVLDIMLPGINGFDVCKAIRAASDVRIIFLTAIGDENHHMFAYRIGADDYLEKPFPIPILTMKIRRMLRLDNGSMLRFSEIEMDPSARKCFVNGEEINLAPKEFSLLEELMRNPGRAISREHLLKTVWGYDYLSDSRVVDTVVKTLRKKLGPASRCIRTVISVGYRLEDPQ